MSIGSEQPLNNYEILFYKSVVSLQTSINV